jgi:transcriptional regulator with XRE-family HTH domain
VRLAALGRPILPSGLSKIEQSTRRVDVDDLVALADALRTVPSRLLHGRDLPSDTQHEEIREEAVLALRACEKAGMSRYEIVEWMDMVDRVVRAPSNAAASSLPRRRESFGACGLAST